METISGLALEKAIGALIHVVEENMDFNPLLSNVQEQLSKVRQVIKDIPPTAAVEGVATIKKEMDEGKKFIEDCCKQRPWYKGVFKKSGLNKKLRSLEKSLGALVPKLTFYLLSYQTKLIEDLCEKKILIRINGLRCPLPKPPSFTVGLEKPLGELSKLILEPGEPIIVITAPAGCGKTTLAQKLCDDKKIKEIFKANIFFVDVSEKPSLHHIVEQLFLHKGYKYILPAKIGNERCTESYLEEFIEAQKQPLLLVLDGVSCDQEYNTLLQKFADLKKRPDLKILVTSRFHFPRFGLYYLNWLEEKDAIKLFRHIAMKGAKRTEFSENYLPQMVQCCKGLPLAITIVGRSVCGQEEEFWNKILQDQSILKSEKAVLETLKSSLKFLDTEEDIHKNLFLDLAAFPEGRIIPAAALIDMWSESYYEDDDTDTDVTCINELHELEHRTVVNLIRPRKASVYGYYGEHFVTQHEMLRELAIMQTRLDRKEERRRLFINISGNQFPKELEQQMCLPKARLLALSTDKAQLSAKWQLPDVEVLVLNLQTIKFELPEFIKEMGKLKVLIITYYGSLPATTELSNFEVFTSLSNLKRVRLERISVPSIAKDLLRLKGVQKLSLFMCDVDQAFSNMSIKFSEALPKLEEMNINYCNDMVQVPTNICDHNLLKKLSITNCHELRALPEEIGNLENLHQLRLVACTNLSELPCSILKLRRLNLLDITDCLRLEKLPSGIDPSVLKVIRSHATNWN